MESLGKGRGDQSLKQMGECAERCGDELTGEASDMQCELL